MDKETKYERMFYLVLFLYFLVTLLGVALGIPSVIFLFIFLIFLSFSIWFSLNVHFQKGNISMFLVYSIVSILSIISLFTLLYAVTGIEKDGTIIHNIDDCFYFSVITFTTLGYGDFSPHDKLSQSFAMTEALVGYILTPILIAIFITLFNKKYMISQISDRSSDIED